MKVNLDLNKNVCTVTKEQADPRYTRGYAEPESTFLYHVLKALKRQGHDVIKKRMWKDGHMMDREQQYIRTQKYCTTPHFTPGEFAIFNWDYAICDLGEEFNDLKAGESLILRVER